MWRLNSLFWRCRRCRMLKVRSAAVKRARYQVLMTYATMVREIRDAPPHYLAIHNSCLEATLA